ncbi:hypothetical protein ACHAXT_009464, partial [Thalassiosira profunda]
MNPQEPPSRPAYPAYCNEASHTRTKRRLPTCIFDLHLDLPHPAAASTDRARIVDPPVAVCPLVVEEMCHPVNLSRLSRLAFPEYDDANVDALNDASAARGVLTSKGRTCGAHLTKYDVYHVDFAGHHHTFSLLLSDGNTRVHGHVRRYLPPHADAAARMDVGRRRPRAMVLLTRAVGGERFYASVLKTAEAIQVESQVNRRGCFAKKRDPARAFLHALFNRHATLIAQYAELRRHGLGLNFARDPGDAKGGSACEMARAVMEANEGLFRIALDKVELGRGGRNRGHIQLENDTVQFHLPNALQPGFECIPLDATPEDAASPIVPLLRCIGPTHFVRLLSALLCERRIVLISKSVARLSVCVRAASAVLAQGLLPWKHILIPVVPPHMLKFLAVDSPYLVGVLHKFAGRLGKLEGLSDVLCVNLDSAELKTLKMPYARATVPDLLRKARGKSEPGPSAAECLARDLEEIAKADRSLWERDAGNNEKKRDNGNKPLDISEMLRSNAAPPTKRSILEKMRNPVKRVQDNAKRSEERRHGNEAVDAAVMFGRMIRATLGREADDDDTATQDDIDATHRSAPKYAAPVQDVDIGSLEPSLAAENEGGEEDVRAALTCFFLHMYGDMGMYLSETHGTFWLDRRKFLLRKKQLGEKDNSPAFAVLQKLSASTMFALHAKGRIDDMSLTARDRSNIMPHHMPLFDVCSKYLAVHRLDFSLVNIRRIASKTVLACPRHMAVERHIAIRTRALALTEDAPFDGDVALAMAELVDECHECNTILSVVMSVIWHRLNQTKSSMAILLALHLLKNLMSLGPLTAITEAVDGASVIYDLRSFSYAKSADLNRDVRQAAAHVYGLLLDLSELFARRRRLAYSKARQQAAVPKSQSTWSDYLVRRLPLTIDARKLHSLFRPEGMDGRAFGDDADGNIAPSVAASATPSVLALSRLKESILELERSPVTYDDEEDQRFNPAEDQHQVESTVRSGAEWLDDSEENRLAISDRTGDDFFLERSLSNSALNYEYADMLASFNDAVS